MDGGLRGPGDDFFCWKYRIWYSMRDCVFRHAWRTFSECAQCGQGAANLKLLGKTPPKPRWAEVLTWAPSDEVQAGER